MPSFAELADEFLEVEFAESPVRASGLGLTEYDERLDDLSEAAFERRRAADVAWLQRFRVVDEQALGFADRIDRDLVVSILRGRQIIEDFEVWRRQPDVYLNPGMTGIFSLFLHRLRPMDKLVDAAVARMRLIPGNLEDGKRNLRPDMVPGIFLDRAANQARAGARYVREILPAQMNDGPLRAKLAEAGEAAGSAYDEYVAFLEEMRPTAAGDYMLGEERYSALLREKELLGFGARELRDRGQAAYDGLALDLTRCARELRGTDDWKAVLDELNEDHPRTPEEMRVGYEEWTERAREYLREHRLVTFPEGESCAVVPSPPFQRPVLAVASYMSPPPFSDRMLGHFFVPFPPDGASEDEIQKRLASNSYPGIPTTAVHEAYPGHHLQLSAAVTNPSLVRLFSGAPEFAEGWAFYCERMMKEAGFDDSPNGWYIVHTDAIWRATRILLDIQLHRGLIGFDDAVDRLVAETGFERPAALAEIKRYTSTPTYQLSYLFGRHMIERLKSDVQHHSGADFDLRRFHDTLLYGGTMPVSYARRLFDLNGR